MKAIHILLLLSINFVIVGQDFSRQYALDEKYALVIGISSYKNSSSNLGYASKDAVDFKEALIDYGKFKKENIKILINKEATRENIRKQIEGWLRSTAKRNDMVVIFFSGHGAQIPDTDGDEDDGLDECLVPYDFDNQDYSSLICDDIFAYWIRNLQSEKILIIFDNCFSGGAAREKGVLLSGVKGNIGKDDFMKDISRELPKKGTALLAASKPDQVSFESSEFKNGVFTHFLLKAITSTSDNDFNRAISARELFYATREKTIEYSKTIYKREQEPIFLDMLVSDLDLFYLPNEKKIGIGNQNSKEIETLEYQANQEKNLTKRLEIYKHLHDLKPGDDGFNLNLASLYESTGNSLKAIEHYKMILESRYHGYGISPPVSALIGKIYKGMHETNLAITYFIQAIKDSPSNYSLYNEIADLYLSNFDTLNTIQSLNKSLNLQPLQKDPYLTLFSLHLDNDDFEVANKLISDSYVINSNDFGTQYCYNLAQKYIAKKPVEDSVFLLIELNSGIKKRISDVTDYNSNLTYIMNNRTLTKQEGQLQLFKDAIRDYPFYAGFYKLYIQYVVDNKIDQDIQSYKKMYLNYSKLNPDKSFIDKYLK